MSLTLSDLIDFCRAEALAGKLYPTEESEYRWFCREYSKTFHTNLPLVQKMEPEHVILTVLENGLDSYRLRKYEDFEKVIEQLRRLEDPNYDATKIKEFDDFASSIEQWEANRVKENGPIPVKRGKSTEQQLLEKDAKKLPSQGFVDLSYLEHSEDER
jgi:hypothetical protein